MQGEPRERLIADQKKGARRHPESTLQQHLQLQLHSLKRCQTPGHTRHMRQKPPDTCGCAYAAFCVLPCSNCASSVEPVKAVVDDLPPSIVCVTASK